MKIDQDLITYLESLARIRLTEAEREATRLDLERILTYMQKLNTLDTSDAKPQAHTHDVPTDYRDDVITCKPNLKAILANAPDQKNGAFKVPKTVE